MSAGFGEYEYQIFTQMIERKLGIRLGDYKSDQMSRRLAVQARKHGAVSFAHYVDRIEKDRAALAGFLETMTINVTELFRNPDLFQILEREVIPSLRTPAPRFPHPLPPPHPGGWRGGSELGPIRVWSAGCSYGAEAYSLAVLLAERGGDFRIDGTDIDLSILARANDPAFIAPDMQNVSPERRARYFRTFDERTWAPTATLKTHTSFYKHDLLADRYPREKYDLIACRNVVIYFTDEAKRRIYEGFFSALKPGGVLFVGGAERLAEHAQLGFQLERPFFYRKPALAEPRKMAA